MLVLQSIYIFVYPSQLHNYKKEKTDLFLPAKMIPAGTGSVVGLSNCLNSIFHNSRDKHLHIHPPYCMAIRVCSINNFSL